MTDCGRPLPSRYKDQWLANHTAVPSRLYRFNVPDQSPFRRRVDLISASGIGNSVLNSSWACLPSASAFVQPNICSVRSVHTRMVPSIFRTMACVRLSNSNNSSKWRPEATGSVEGSSLAGVIRSTSADVWSASTSKLLAATSRGIVNENSAPSPGRPSAQMRPPNRWTMRLQMVSPMPVPSISVPCKR